MAVFPDNELIDSTGDPLPGSRITGIKHVDIHKDEHLLKCGLVWQLGRIRDRKVENLFYNDITRTMTMSLWDWKCVDENGEEIILNISCLHKMPKNFLKWKPALCRKRKGGKYIIHHYTDAFFLASNGIYPVKRSDILLNEEGETMVLYNGENIRDASQQYAPPIAVLWVKYHHSKKDENSKRVAIKIIPIRSPIPGSFLDALFREREYSQD